MQQIFDALKQFDFTQAHTHLWVFKKSTTATKFNSFYVQTDNTLNNILKGVVTDEMRRVTEVAAYSYLAETNENSCLSTLINGTDFEQLKTAVDRPEPDHRARSVKDLQNAEGYVAKFTHNNQTVYGIKRSTNTWKTRYKKNYVNLIFKDGELSAVDDNEFSIEKNFDFYAFRGRLFIANKRSFESAMSYRAGYTQAFTSLQTNQTFSGLFTDITPLVNYVGTNSIQLRRMATIEQKGLFQRPGFLTTLQQVNASRQWGLNFDPNTNQLIPCDQTIKTIIQVMLDHRLLSEVTQNIYDVPDATQV